MNVRLLTEDGGEVVGFTGGDYNQYVIVRYGSRLRVQTLEDTPVIDPAEAERIELENHHWQRSFKASQTNAIAGPQTGRGVR